VVLPSLDAGDRRTFDKINCPHKDIVIENLISGLCFFREEFAGQIWLEVFLVEGLNTDSGQIGLIKKAIDRIKPDKVHLNTAVRPTAQADIKRVDIEKLEAIAKNLGGNCEVIADFPPARYGEGISRHDPDAIGPAAGNSTSSSLDISPNGDSEKLETLLSMLKRRPCSLNDICSSLDVHRNQALKYVASLRQQGAIKSFEKDGVTFFKSIRR
jgi:biotin operon repressor